MKLSSLKYCISALLISVMPVRADNWYPSSYGAEDTIGAANNLSPEIILKAAKLIKTGKVYELGINIGDKTQSQTQPFGHRSYNLTVVPVKQNDMVGHDDSLYMWMGTFGTSMDGLGHMGIKGKYYNGIPEKEVYGISGLKKLGTHDIPPIVSRGILLDFARYLGVERVKESTPFNKAEIDAVLKAQNISLRRGDVVLLHTGWLPSLIKDPGQFIKAPGLDVEGARYLAEAGVVAVGADTQSVEVLPPINPDPNYAFPVHRILLAENGVYLLEDVKTEELAKDKVYEFLFVLGAPKFFGAVQVPVNPIAIR